MIQGSDWGTGIKRIARMVGCVREVVVARRRQDWQERLETKAQDHRSGSREANSDGTGAGSWLLVLDAGARAGAQEAE